MTLTSGEARSYVNGIIEDVSEALKKHPVMNGFTLNYRHMMARAMKNKFMEWCHEYRKHNR